MRTLGQGGRDETVDFVLADERAGPRGRRELAAFARYCVDRIERELGDVGHWFVHVTPCAGGFMSTIEVADDGDGVAVVATGLDGGLAIWDAMCRIEQHLRETRSGRRRHQLSPGRP